MYLSPPSSYFNKASQNRVLSSFPNPAIRPIASAKPHRLLLTNPQSFPNSKTHSTLWKCVGCVWVEISSQDITMEKGRRRSYNDFSLRMSRSLSKRMSVCVVENISRVFLSKWPLLLLWVMRVYIVWVKGKKVALKNPSGKEFRRYLTRRPYLWDTREILQASMTLQLPACASHVALSRVSS